MRTGVAVAAFSLVLLMLASRLRAPDNRPPSTWQDRTTGMQFVLINPGTFVMGSPPGEAGREAQETQHTVTLTRPFYMGRFEVTQAEWMRVMGRNPSHFQDCGSRCPVERVSFDDIVHFLERLNDLSEPGFRLPTEAEWEYACRADGTRPFGAHASLSSRDANINGGFPYNAAPDTFRERTMPVGQFGANPWGLFDMAGNVWEWTEDWHCPYGDNAATDPHGRCDSEFHVIRGGSWLFDGNSARCGLRYTHRSQDSGYSLGLRLVHDAS
jgi:formylglycine-generating enzyme required for sulfatase activity